MAFGDTLIWNSHSIFVLHMLLDKILLARNMTTPKGISKKRNGDNNNNNNKMRKEQAYLIDQGILNLWKNSSDFRDTTSGLTK